MFWCWEVDIDLQLYSGPDDTSTCLAGYGCLYPTETNFEYGVSFFFLPILPCLIKLWGHPNWYALSKYLGGGG